MTYDFEWVAFWIRRVEFWKVAPFGTRWLISEQRTLGLDGIE